MTEHILHICRMEKFIPPFIDLVDKHFDEECHEFVLFGDHDKFPVTAKRGRHIVGSGFWAKQLAKCLLIFRMHNADRIVLHGLFNRSVTNLLWLMPWLLPKCYWVMWGNDLYSYESNGRKKRRFKEFLRRRVIRRMGHLVTHVEGDVELARKWYGARGTYRECLMYISNTYRGGDPDQPAHEVVNIQVGNSADPSNNHLEVLERLLPFKEERIRIFVPLSYGNQHHAKRIVAAGTQMFGDKFVPLMDFMSFEEYHKFLADIDIAVFNHKRQQGMGNTVNLLGLGKKVYLRSDVTPWASFVGKGLEIYDVRQLDLLPMDESTKDRNRQIIREQYSESTLLAQLQQLFEG